MIRLAHVGDAYDEGVFAVGPFFGGSPSDDSGKKGSITC